MILDNSRITIREAIDDAGISFGSFQAIFQWNFEQKQHHMNIAQEMLMTFNDNPDLLKKFITHDESCLYGYDIETKAQIIAMEAARRAKSTSNSVKYEGFAYCFLRLQWRRVSWILATRLYGQYVELLWSYATIARSNSSEILRIVEKLIILLHDNAQYRTHRLICVSFWPKTNP